MVNAVATLDNNVTGGGEGCTYVVINLELLIAYYFTVPEHGII